MHTAFRAPSQETVGAIVTFYAVSTEESFHEQSRWFSCQMDTQLNKARFAVSRQHNGRAKVYFPRAEPRGTGALWFFRADGKRNTGRR